MLNELLNYYEYVSRQPDSDFVPDGYSRVTNVAFNLVLTADGEIKAILPYTHKVLKGKKETETGFHEIYPQRLQIPGISAETIDCREKYLFGLEWDQEAEKYVVTKSSLAAYEKSKRKNAEFLSDLSSPVIDAYKAFLERWRPEAETENELLLAVGKSYNGAKFIVTVEGREDGASALHRDKAVTEKWDRQWGNQTEEDAPIRQCALTGKMAPLARTHNNLMGVRGGLATGVNLVCFKTSAFESYGKKQSYNSSISQEAMERYTKTFNYLTSSDAHHRALNDMTLLFWANTVSSERPYDDLFWEVVENVENTDQSLERVGSELEQGRAANWRAAIDPDTTFCVLAVKPNSSRLAVKMFEKDHFGNFMANVEKHQADLRLDKEDKQLSVWAMLQNLKSPTKSDDVLPPDLSVKLFHAILKGGQYPAYMLGSAVRRAKTDRDDEKKKFKAVNRTRIRIIKACLVRSGYYKGDEYMLESKHHTEAYTSGRLFAVLEKVQSDALGNIDATIKDKFFASACATPDLVFPRLLKLSGAHLAKLSEGSKIYYDKLLQEIMSDYAGEKFPHSLSMQQQGDFMIGYYQQKQKFYEKKDKTGEEQS